MTVRQLVTVLALLGLLAILIVGSLSGNRSVDRATHNSDCALRYSGYAEFACEKGQLP